MVCRVVLVCSALMIAATAAGAGGGPIAEAQRQLRQEGYDPGPANGVLTDRTTAAIRAWRHAAAAPELLPPAVAATGDAVIATQRALSRLG